MSSIQLEQLIQALPVRPVTYGAQGKMYFSVLVLLVCWQGEYHFIFEKRSPNVRQGGEVCFPGGKVEKKNDRDSRETALRETFEEIGIPPEKIEIIGQLDTFAQPLGPIIDAYVGVAGIESLADLRIQKDEVAYTFAVPLDYFMERDPEVYQTLVKIHPSYVDASGQEVVLFPAREIGLPEKYTKAWGGTVHRILVYKYGEEIIWGLTAKFVAQLVKWLRQTGIGTEKTISE